MKSTEFLQAALDVQKERGEQYDKPSGERSMAATVSAFNCITGYTLEESDGWMFMALLKLVRQAQNPEKYHHDSALDLVAYSSLYAEAASEQCGQLDRSTANWSAAPEFADCLVAHTEDGERFWVDSSSGKAESLIAGRDCSAIDYPSKWFTLIEKRPGA